MHFLIFNFFYAFHFCCDGEFIFKLIPKTFKLKDLIYFEICQKSQISKYYAVFQFESFFQKKIKIKNRRSMNNLLCRIKKYVCVLNKRFLRDV